MTKQEFERRVEEERAIKEKAVPRHYTGKPSSYVCMPKDYAVPYVEIRTEQNPDGSWFYFYGYNVVTWGGGGSRGKQTKWSPDEKGFESERAAKTHGLNSMRSLTKGKETDTAKEAEARRLIAKWLYKHQQPVLF